MPAPLPKKTLLNHTLYDLEELRHFPSDTSRQRALDALATAMRPRDLVLGAAITAAAGFLGFVGVGYLHRHAPFPIHRIFVEILSLAAGGTFVYFTLRWLHRIDAAKALRKSLVQDGVPVCLGCGYLLRGLPASTAACPECGQTISDRARSLLAEIDPLKAGSETESPQPPALSP